MVPFAFVQKLVPTQWSRSCTQPFCTIKITAPGQGPLCKLSKPIINCKPGASHSFSFSLSLCPYSAAIIKLEQGLFGGQTEQHVQQNCSCCGFLFLKKITFKLPPHQTCTYEKLRCHIKSQYHLETAPWGEVWDAERIQACAQLWNTHIAHFWIKANPVFRLTVLNALLMPWVQLCFGYQHLNLVRI